MQSVVIATPFYNHQGYVNYINSMVQTSAVLTKLEIPFEFMAIVGDSYIDRARNAIVQKFLKEEQFFKYDKLFFIDSDMRWNVEAFLEMLGMEEDFVGAAYPMKNKFDDFSVRHFVNDNGTPKCNKHGLIESHLVPGGFLCLTRKCLQEMDDKWRTEYMQTYVDTSSAYKGFTTNLFENRVINGGQQGEDSTFCEKWRNLGHKVWCYPNVDFGHIGMKEYTGNYHNVLINQPKPGVKS